VLVDGCHNEDDCRAEGRQWSSVVQSRAFVEVEMVSKESQESNWRKKPETAIRH